MNQNLSTPNWYSPKTESHQEIIYDLNSDKSPTLCVTYSKGTAEIICKAVNNHDAMMQLIKEVANTDWNTVSELKDRFNKHKAMANQILTNIK